MPTMDFRLIYLQEGRTYGAEELRGCIAGQLPESGDEPKWLDGDFFHRLTETMNRGPKIVVERGEECTFGFIGLYDYVDEKTEKNLTFFFMPKFCDIGNMSNVSPESRDTVLLAIDRYFKELEQQDVQGEDTEPHVESLLELAIRVLRDYLENGVYTVRRRELEHNGQGEIDWDTTIDQYQPVFVRGRGVGEPRPIYMDTATELALSDEDHYITRLHQCLVTTWGRKLEKLGLSAILRVSVPLLSEDELDHFGPTEFQINQIRKELNNQFVTKSRHTLQLMEQLIEASSDKQNEWVEQLSFGTNKAEHLWEEACAQVLGSELDMHIGNCGLQWNRGGTFRDYMPKPIWRQEGRTEQISTDDEAYKPESEKSGWQLDFIRTWRPHERVEKIVILDAKYYGVSWSEGKISGQPGIGDIAKQIFYQMAFQDLVNGKEIGFMNAFLFPENDDSKVCQKDDAGRPTIQVSETVQLGWPDGKAKPLKARAFADVDLFAVRIPGIELFRRYAHYEAAEDWFRKIAQFDSKQPFNN